MAQDQVLVECPAREWTQLTNAAVSSLTFQVHGGAVYVRTTATAVAPTEAHGVVYQPLQGEADALLTDIVQANASGYVWAKPLSGTASRVYVDHA